MKARAVLCQTSVGVPRVPGSRRLLLGLDPVSSSSDEGDRRPPRVIPHGPLLHGRHLCLPGFMLYPDFYNDREEERGGRSTVRRAEVYRGTGDAAQVAADGDVKCNNILLDTDFGTCIANFGVAKVVEASGKGIKSMSMITGSCGYIDPVCTGV